jgi:pimeloyl-ACP methyl ester carboxylesterase
MRGYVNTSDGQIHYRSAGTTGPALVMIPESPLSTAIFEEILPELGKSLRVWAFDTPGYGMSDPPSEPITIPEYARRILAAIDGLSIREFAIAGAHAAASIATEVACQAGPQRVTHAILTGVSVITEEERAAFWKKGWTLRDVEPDANGAYLKAVWDFYRAWWGPQTSPRLMHIAVMHVVNNYERYKLILDASVPYRPDAALQQLQCPVLVYSGRRDVLSHTDQRVAALVANATVGQGPDVAGQLWGRAPQEYVRAIVDFVTAR